MFVIGHRGAAGLAAENTMQAFDAAVAAGVDMIEFDVRLTKDHIPVVIHDALLLRTHHNPSIISNLSLDELRLLTVSQPVPTLVEVLDKFFGKVLLNIDIKGNNTGKVTIDLLISNYIKKPSDWDLILFASSRGKELSAIRKLSHRAQLATYNYNPFIFMAYDRRLKLTAVGFHHLYICRFALKIAKRRGLFTYAYTVDSPHEAVSLTKKGIDGIVTNNPDIVNKKLTD